MNNLKQSITGITFYANDNKDWMPRFIQNRELWHDIHRYLGLKSSASKPNQVDTSVKAPVAICPSDDYRNKNHDVTMSWFAYGQNYYARSTGFTSPYAYHNRLRKLSGPKNQTRLLVLADGQRKGTYPGSYTSLSANTWPMTPTADPSGGAVEFRHNGRANMNFFDGHVASKSLSEMSGRKNMIEDH